MGALNSVQLEKWIAFLIVRDGPFCCKIRGDGCGTHLEKLQYKIQVDHIDDNRENNPADGSNYQLLCMSCNIKKSKRKQFNSQTNDRPMTPEQEKSEILTPLFEREINHRINQNNSCCLGEAIYDVTMVIGASVQFGRDHIKQNLGSSGIWDIGPGKCKSSLCKRKHIYLKGYAPAYE